VEVVPLPDDLFAPQGSGLERPSGLHVSDIYTDMDVTLNGAPDHWENAGEPGFLWEDVFSHAWSNKALARGLIFRPEPERVDGIWVSPDGVNLDGMRLEEYKFTWKSSNRPPEDNWKWVTQMKAYCWALKLGMANLRVFYCNGDYRQNRKPQYKAFRFTFEAWELKENWDMLINHAKSRGWL